MYPEKLLTQHFLSPAQRKEIEATLIEKKKRSFSTLVQLLKDTQEDDQLSALSKILEQVQHSAHSLRDAVNEFNRRLPRKGLFSLQLLFQ